MAKVIVGASMSLDGYVSGPENSGFDQLFRWYNSGDIEITTTNPELSFRLTETSAAYVRGQIEDTAALVVGRGVFDTTGGWGGLHPLGSPVVVLTHQVPEGWEREGKNFIFVTEGIEAAVARASELAGDKIVGVAAGTIGSQALAAGLVDELWVDLVPVVLGGGTPYFQSLGTTPVDGPFSVEQGIGVTHLKYRVAK
ncbi:dihydrofolate reductase family protein [Crossiella sp. CA-258035]|uniref:dihydrofolate reductase family protein n=1 Tax=Crossiella sp. CA-258035 TaxID=2981138 RepID=UPI0024BD2F13|nr:dihydrofolate reductase family protein [Crossiella sp. CA-258035]WHT16413.1 dihydrofolate reductase family protein [Crossiella sp. CA-258035]